jgi:thymidylate synthase (FAD)
MNTRTTRLDTGSGSVELVGVNIDLQSLQGIIPSDFTLDHLVEQAARVSYSNETKKSRSTAGLIDYLMRHQHTSPFEQVNFTFKVRAPLFVVQQLLRHRTARLNQESARYSVLDDVAYTPEVFRGQHQHNKQGSGEAIDQEMDEHVRERYWTATETALGIYNELLEAGVSREQARGVVPHATYTSLVWQIDLHNLFRFLKLRLDAHAQLEIRQLAQAIYQIARPWAPLSFESWENHVLNAVTLSADEQAYLLGSLAGIDIEKVERGIQYTPLSDSRKRELGGKFEQMCATSFDFWDNWHAEGEAELLAG